MCFEFPADLLNKPEDGRICDNHRVASDIVVNKGGGGRVLEKRFLAVT